MNEGIQTYASENMFATMFSSFSDGFNAVMNFLTSNPWMLVIVATPVILGLISVVMSFIKSRM